MKTYARLKQDEFAEKYLANRWPDDWDGTEFDAALVDWQKAVNVALLDALIIFKNEREQQKAEAAVEASRG